MMSLKLKEEQREEGFTLIELLVVVIIIGILAAIAIPVFLNQRESAWRSAVESDLRNAAMQFETVYTREGEYPQTDAGPITGTFDLEVATDQATGVEITVSDNIELSWTNDGDGTYTISGTHTQLPDAEDTLTYDSETGGLGDTWS